MPDTATDTPKRLITLDQFDSKAASESGIMIELDEIGLDEEGKPYFITVMGDDAAAVVDDDRKRTNKRNAHIRKTRKIIEDAEENEAGLIDKLAKATRTWHLPPLKACSWFTPPDGVEASEPLCSERNARNLYGDSRFRWILRKVAAGQGDESGFFVKRSPS